MDTVLIQQTVITARDMKSELKLAIYLFVVQVVLTSKISEVHVDDFFRCMSASSSEVTPPMSRGVL